ncbi:hypothetical protein PG996_005287 [Apiospora saccharicola]|uniref:Uncharacterized protein n=1 Tax=Apiospora saccharicola TaxID=335842 RepID=A0ABR1VL26_9PEZI
MSKDNDDEDARRYCNCTDPGLCRAELSRELDTVKRSCSAGLRGQGSWDLIVGAQGGLDTYPTASTCISRWAGDASDGRGRSAGDAETQKRLCIGLMEKLDIIVRAGRFCKSVSGVFSM